MSDASTTRRGFFERVAGGLHGAALVSLLGRGSVRGLGPAGRRDAGRSARASLTPRPPHFEPKAKAVIHLFMNGGPSQMDLFDPKPTLDKHHGKAYFDKIAGEVENPQGRRGLDAQPVQVRPARRVRHVGLRGDAAPRQAGRRHRPHPLDVHHQPDARAGPLPDPVGQDGARPPVARARGSSTAWAARTRTCPPTSCSTTRSACRSTASRTGRRASCRRSSRARGSARPARPC